MIVSVKLLGGPGLPWAALGPGGLPSPSRLARRGPWPSPRPVWATLAAQLSALVTSTPAILRARGTLCEGRPLLLAEEEEEGGRRRRRRTSSHAGVEIALVI